MSPMTSLHAFLLLLTANAATVQMEGGAESTESGNGGPARSKLAALLLALAAPQAAQGFQVPAGGVVPQARSSQHAVMSVAQDGGVDDARAKACSACAAIAAAMAIGMAAPALAADLAQGESVFSNNCAACHSGGGNVVEPAKTLEKEALQEYLAGGMNEAAVKTQVANGKNSMPAWKDRLSAEEIANVAAYVIDSANKGWE